MESNKSHIFNGLQDITGQEGTQDPETPLEPILVKTSDEIAWALAQ
jgi:hypothetical protein